MIVQPKLEAGGAGMVSGSSYSREGSCNVPTGLLGLMVRTLKEKLVLIDEASS